MPRLSRAASQARTRAQLIETARELFLRDGYFATSLDKVADAAGYSKGAVYSNFASKDELCLAVLDALLAERAAQIAAAGRPGASGSAGKLAAFEKWADPGASATRAGSRSRSSSPARPAPIRSCGGVRRAGRRRSARRSRWCSRPAPHEAGGRCRCRPRSWPRRCSASGSAWPLQRAFDPAVSVRTLTNTIRVVVGLPIRQPAARRRRRAIRASASGSSTTLTGSGALRAERAAAAVFSARPGRRPADGARAAASARRRRRPAPGRSPAPRRAGRPPPAGRRPRRRCR